MRFDDRTADGESHPHSVAFGCEKSIEDTVHIQGINAGPGVLYGD
jgi:hypothetical protein